MGMEELGCFGMKIPAEYGGLEMPQVAYNPALIMVSTVGPVRALLPAHQPIGVPEPLEFAGIPGAEAKVPAALRTRRGIGVTADTTRRGLRPGAAWFHAYALADTFCRQATLRGDTLFHAWWTNTDSGDVQLTHDVLECRHTWPEEGIFGPSEGAGP